MTTAYNNHSNGVADGFHTPLHGYSPVPHVRSSSDTPMLANGGFEPAPNSPLRNLQQQQAPLPQLQPQHQHQFYVPQKHAVQQQIQQMQRRAFLAEHQATAHPSGTLSQMIADVDRRTRRSDTYIVKKIEDTERRHENNNSRHRVARDFYGADPDQQQQASQMYSQLRNGGANRHIAGMRLRMIQEDIARRRMQTEQALAAVNTSNTTTTGNPRSMSLVRNGASTVVVDYDSSAAADDIIEKSNAVRRRLEEARRSTAASVKGLYEAALHSLQRRESDERSGVAAEQLQQFARITAYKAMDYVSAASSPRSVAAHESELERFLQLSGYKRTSPTQARPPSGGSGQNYYGYNSNEHPDELQQFHHRNSNENEDYTTPAAFSPNSGGGYYSPHSNNNSRNNNIEVMPKPQHSKPRVQRSPPSEAAVSAQVTPQRNDNNDSEVVRTTAKRNNSSEGDSSLREANARLKQDAATLSHMFVTENFARREAQIRQDIATEAFDTLVPLALQSPVLIRGATAKQPRSTNAASTPVKSGSDNRVLGNLFVTENLLRRELQLRQEIINDAFDEAIDLARQVPTLARKVAVASQNAAQVQKLGLRTKQDYDAVRNLFVVENLDRREAQSRQGIVVDAFSGLLALALYAPRAPTDGNVKSRAVPNPVAATLDAKTIASLHSTIVQESLLLRESETRNATELEAWRGYLNMRHLLVAEAPSPARRSQSSSPRSNNNNSNSNSDYTAQDRAVMRELFIQEQLMRREAEMRSEIAQDGLSFSAAAARWKMPVGNNNSINANAGGQKNNMKHQQQKRAAQDGAVLRDMFVVENFLRRESEARARISEEALAVRMDAASQFAVGLQRLGGGSKPGSKPASRPGSAASKKSLDVLREMFITENFFHRESDIRSRIMDEAAQTRMQAATAFFQRSSVLLRSEFSSSFGHFNNNNNNNNASGGFDEQNALLRDLFVRENFVRRESEMRSEIVQQWFVALMELSSLRNAARGSSAAGAAALAADKATLTRLFVIENMLHRESTARMAVQDEESRRRIWIALNLRPFGVAHALTLRNKKDLATLREQYLGEFMMRRQMEGRAALQLQAAQEQAGFFSDGCLAILVEQQRKKAKPSAAPVDDSLSEM